MEACVKYTLKEAKVKIGKSKVEIKRALIREFNKFIRNRDGGVCISCGKACEKGDAGHFIPSTKQGTRFNEYNVNVQCVSCNRYQHGNLSGYAVGLLRKYPEPINGMNVIEYLHSIKNNSVSKAEMETLLEKYKNLNKGILFSIYTK
jgi:hypothetical protein